jgi:hypothetical protein
MKTFRFALIALLGLAAATALRADAPAVSPVDVTFVNPEKFTDVKDYYMPTDSGRDAILADLKDYIVKRASARLAAGQHLTVTVTDIDLAGDFEPWHGSQMQDIRVIKDIYAPKVNLSFTLTDDAGKIVKQGERKLRNMNFTMNINSIGRSDPRFYDKALLDDWINDDLPRVKDKR